MRANLRVLMAAACLGAAGSSISVAQTSPAAGGVVLEGCGASCRFLHSLTGSAPAVAQEQGEGEQQQPGRPRGGMAERRQSGSRIAEESGKANRPARRNAPSAEEIEQTSSLPDKPGEILLVAGADEAHWAIANDLAGVMGPDLPMRVVSGKGLPLRDVLSLPDADLTITSSLGLARGSALSEKVVYVTKLFTEELHAVGAPGLARIEDLQGKPVYLGPADSDSEAAARAFLQSRGIAVKPVAGSLASALAALREGRVAAAFILAPKPLAALRELRAADRLRVLPLVYRPSDTDFHPAALSAADYPGLVGEGERIETVALDAVLVAPRWRETSPRQQELAAFTARFFERLGALHGEGRHPKWSETNLAASLDGFARLKPAQQWIEARLKARQTSPGAASEGRVMGMGAAR